MNGNFLFFLSSDISTEINGINEARSNHGPIKFGFRVNPKLEITIKSAAPIRFFFVKILATHINEKMNTGDSIIRKNNDNILSNKILMNKLKP